MNPPKSFGYVQRSKDTGSRKLTKEQPLTVLDGAHHDTSLACKGLSHAGVEARQVNRSESCMLTRVEDVIQGFNRYRCSLVERWAVQFYSLE